MRGRHVRELSDAPLKKQWLRLRTVVADELEAVAALEAECAALRCQAEASHTGLTEARQRRLQCKLVSTSCACVDSGWHPQARRQTAAPRTHAANDVSITVVRHTFAAFESLRSNSSAPALKLV